MAAIRAAYRKRALETHPDRGGSPGAFLQVQHAYQRLTEALNPMPTPSSQRQQQQQHDGSLENDHHERRAALTQRVDVELREHRALVEEWFARDGEDLRQSQSALTSAIEALGLTVVDVGATNTNENGDTMYNQCFYLSISRAFLSGGGEPARDVLCETALHFKRVIEAAVLRAHPEWADKQVGEDLQAFSDFLFFVLSGSNALLSELAVAVFDVTTGGVEVYRGIHYPNPAKPPKAAAAAGGAGGSGASEDETLRANLLCIQYVPGHYQSLVANKSSGSGPTLAELLNNLDLHDVKYVITDGEL